MVHEINPSVADPGLPRRGGANPRGGEPIINYNFCQKLYENAVGRVGAKTPSAPLDLPLLFSIYFSSTYKYFEIWTEKGGRVQNLLCGSATAKFQLI